MKKMNSGLMTIMVVVLKTSFVRNIPVLICHNVKEEGIISCRRDAMSIDMGEEYYIVYATSYNFDTGNYDGEEFIYGVYQVFDYKENRRSG